MPSYEGKSSSEGKEASGGGGEMDPVVQKFIEFAVDVDSDLMTRTKKFVESNYHGFERLKKFEETGAGHPIEWTQRHASFCEAVEEELERYCKVQEVSEEDLFSRGREL